MIGMIQILTYLLGVYLIFKGVEIFQIALMSTSRAKSAGIILGVIMMAVSVLAAYHFINLADAQAMSVENSMKNR